VERVVKKVAKLREKTKQYGDEISELLGISPDASDPRSGCFPMVFNHVTFTLEVLSYYQSVWTRPRVILTPVKGDRLRKQNAERCNKALKWLFIGSLSSMEFSAKASVASCGACSPAKDLTKVKGQYIYLTDIMRNSKKYGLIDDNEYEDWQNLNFLRNCIVHNNAISDRDKTFDIAGISVVASEGKMLQGKLDFFAVLTEVAVERYFAWVKALINKYST